MILIDNTGTIIAATELDIQKIDESNFLIDKCLFTGDFIIVEVNLPEGYDANYTRYVDGQFVQKLPPEPPEPEPPAPPAPSMEDRMSAVEAKVEANTQSNAFLEDCVAEMAGVVYA